ncbi:MAG: hypothetical protein JWP16_2474 [Alphaproteobacteria bacterium]|jgi:hypothetical protein|nr:hypothetical protein [Alphaproteobacteria bacterium]MDB5741434.1 hypothetical protein [Alphaproteobacteria bacterium]
MTKILNSIQSEATTIADFFQVATITLAGAVAFLTVASTF